jgi:uncharacterized OB-fold protein
VSRPLPVVDDLTKPYWDAASEGRLLLQRCTSCGEHQFYPRPFCLGCEGDQLEWVEATGRGRLHTYSVVHRTADAAFQTMLPYAFGVVRLEEGPFITVDVVDTPLEDLRCDLPVRIVFTEVGEAISLPNATSQA